MYREEPASFEAVQWTGDNAQAVADAAGAYYGVTFTHSVDPTTQSLTLDAIGATVQIPDDHWYVMGPIWGDVKSGGSELVDDATFQVRFAVED